MSKLYLLKNAITHKATSVKVNVLASPTTDAELVKHKAHFSFKFYGNKRIIYKLTTEKDTNTIQGIVSFTATPVVLECGNTETAIHNRGKSAIYTGLGKAMVALCCKISFDNGMDGFISFESKGRLTAYYSRMGAKNLTHTRMYIDEVKARKLVEQYF
jgi:hypothetical protein